jgi:pentapeptide repeat protein
MGLVNGGPINLASARLRRASLRFATLTGANLDGADLSGADLTDARLDRANLANADLSEAVLDHTDFASAGLTGAILCGANLSKARNLTEAQLTEAFGDETTVLPPQFKAPEHWTARAVEPVRVQRPRAETLIAPRPRSDRANTVSWLVGGPLQTA